MFLAVVLTILGLGFICWLLFTLAVYALPFFAAVTAGMWAYGTGAGALGSIVIGFLAGVTTLIAGYHAILGVSVIGVPSETWRQVFAVVGATIIGFTAAARLTLFTDLSAKPSSAADGTGEPVALTSPEPTSLPRPSATFTVGSSGRAAGPRQGKVVELAPELGHARPAGVDAPGEPTP